MRPYSEGEPLSLTRYWQVRTFVAPIEGQRVVVMAEGMVLQLE